MKDQAVLKNVSFSDGIIKSDRFTFSDVRPEALFQFIKENDPEVDLHSVTNSLFYDVFKTSFILLRNDDFLDTLENLFSLNKTFTLNIYSRKTGYRVIIEI